MIAGAPSRCMAGLPSHWWKAHWRAPSFSPSANEVAIMPEMDPRYDIETGTIMFGPAKKFDVNAVGAAQMPWWNRTLCAVNDTWVRLGVMEGNFHWHKHDDTDEFFLVIEGHLDIELED